MSDPLIDAEDDTATPLTPEERAALIPTYITLRPELNEVEQIGIDEANLWAFSRKRDVLNEDFLKQLHKHMFGKVWRWAGEFRTTPRNIGIDAWNIAPELRILLDNVRYWIENNTYSPDEIAVRFHHKLVFIHPFPNGNGRHARLAADILVTQLDQPRLTWGSSNLVTVNELRKSYVTALQSADREDIGALLVFACS